MSNNINSGRKHFTIALIISLAYLVAGNIVGMQQALEKYPGSGFIEIIFGPYTFIAGMSSFAGWDWLSFVLELIVFIITIPFFYLTLVAFCQIKTFLKMYFRNNEKQ